MLPGYRLGLDNSYAVQHRWKQPIEPHEEQSVDNGEFSALWERVGAARSVDAAA
jgi:hypothetical protein